MITDVLYSVNTVLFCQCKLSWRFEPSHVMDIALSEVLCCIIYYYHCLDRAGDRQTAVRPPESSQ